VSDQVSLTTLDVTVVNQKLTQQENDQVPHPTRWTTGLSSKVNLPCGQLTLKIFAYKFGHVTAKSRGPETLDAHRVDCLALPQSGWLADCSQVDVLGVRYESVNFGAKTRPGSPNW
jgi:hypothetical protein